MKLAQTKDKAFLVVDIGSNSIVWTLVKASPLDADSPFTLNEDCILLDGCGRSEAQLKKGLNGQGALDDIHFHKMIGVCKAALDKAVIVSKNANLALEPHFFATQFLRMAANREYIKTNFQTILHEPLRILEADEEAGYEVLAVNSSPVAVQNPGKPFLHIDLGGGSTEISFINGERRCTYTRSVNAGMLDFLKAYPGCQKDIFKDCIEQIREGAALLKPEFVVMAGSSVTSYARYALNCNNQPFDARLVESKLILPGAEVDEVDQKALIGKLFVSAVADLLPIPIYSTTKGVRFGYIMALFQHCGYIIN